MRKRLTAFALALLFVTGPVARADEPLEPPDLPKPEISFTGGGHTYYRSHTYTPAADLTYAVNTMLHGGARLEEEHILAFQPSESLLPVVVAPDTMFGKGITLQDAIARLKSQGYDVVAGINAGFFNSNMTPIGLQIRDGVLTALPYAGEPVVGFRADGSAVFGDPRMSITVSREGGSAEGGSVAVDRLNKVRSPDLVFLYTPQYSDNTQLTQDGLQIVLRVSGPLSLGEPLTGTVTRLIQGKTSYPMAADEMVLTASSQNAIDRLAFLREGDAVTVSASCSDARWHDVTQAVGGLHALVKDGQNTNASDNARAPRTVIGVTEDGTVVFYTVDGRQTGYSVGLTLAEAADRMIGMGCVTAFELDGGGSTAISVRLPGEADARLAGRPSDGVQRRCADFILLCNAAPPSDGRAAHLFPQPAYVTVMPGASVPFTLLATDEHYRPVPAPAQEITVTPDVTSLGTLQGLTYRASQPGQTALTFRSLDDDVLGAAQVTVTDRLDSLTLISADTGRVLTALTIEAEKTARLAAVGTRNRMPVVSSAYSFEWSADEQIGTLTPEGVFTASSVPGQTGQITVSGGGQTLSLPVLVEDSYDNGLVIDITPPVPEDGYLELVYRLKVHDVNGDPCPEIAVRWDGAELDIVWEGCEAIARVPWPDAELHILSVEATDALGRRARAADIFDFGRGFSENAIADLLAEDGEEAWYTGYVDFLDDRNIVDTQTLEDGPRVFDPMRSVTRLEVMRMFARILNLSPDDSALPFLDTEGLSEDDLAVARAVVNAGLVSGKPTEGGVLLDPDGSMTRSELFFILYRTLPPGYSLSRLTEFTDAPAIPAYALRGVQTLVGMGIVSGSAGRINPLDTISRAETAVLLCRFFY